MAFKIFEKGSSPASSIPSVTIQKKGLFSLNEAAAKLLGEPEAIQFLWDEDERLIALKAVHPEAANAHPTRRQASPKSAKDVNKGPIIVTGTAFTKFINLDTSQAHRWMPRLEDDLLIIDLKVDGQLVISNRTRGQKMHTTEG